ncbi:FxsA family protein [Kineosporia sp. R_H_3]|uniref:FxsA family protein n=1 Tax=Kineosporia sp. R_H_3 TaxID=1961848 RepID=UPI000B4B295B|nr:FxsA family protein [Kineosporia sp. R_H_3]
MTAGPVRGERPGGPARRRPGAGRWLLAGALLLPVVEIAAAVAVAGRIGAGWTVVALVALSGLGVVVLGRAARGAVAALGPVPGAPPGAAATGAVPGASSARGTDLALEATGGVLLALPGFVTAALGALLLLPPVRRLLRPALGAGAARIVRSVVRRGQVRVVSGETVDVRVVEVRDIEVRDVDPAAPSTGPVTDAGPGRRPALPGEVVEPDER